MSVQPYRSDERLIVEKRDEHGNMLFDSPYPPTRLLNTNIDELYQEFFRENPDADGTPENLQAWLDSKQWHVRRRTW